MSEFLARGRLLVLVLISGRPLLASRSPLASPSGRSLELAAFVARNRPLDDFVRLRRTAPHPTARAEKPAPEARAAATPCRARSPVWRRAFRASRSKRRDFARDRR